MAVAHAPSPPSVVRVDSKPTRGERQAAHAASRALLGLRHPEGDAAVCIAHAWPTAYMRMYMCMYMYMWLC
jgi:hypothetical protein